MNTYSTLSEALVFEKINRFQAEAASHRLARAIRPQSPSARDRLAQAIGRGLAAIAEPLKVDRRPRIPAI
jgi:hypothetical protein